MAGVLTFGDLTFPGQSGGVYFDALGSQEGTSWGAADALVREVESFLQDGAIAATDRFGNRDLIVRVRIKAMTSIDLASGEAMLVAERRKCDPVGGMNRMTWTPPDGGPTSVFEVVAARLDLDFDDQAEVGYDGNPPLYRYYQLALTALPYASSANPVTITVPAPPSSSTAPVVVDDATATTAWAIAPSAGNVSQFIYTSQNWRAFEGVTSVFAECVGGGGGGAYESSGGTIPGGGGGGGAYAAFTLAVTPGTSYPVVVAGAAGPGIQGATSTFTAAVQAQGGYPGNGINGGAGGQAAGSAGSTKASGAAGGAGYYTNSGFNLAGGSGGNGGPPLGGSYFGRGGNGQGDGGGAAAGYAGVVRLTYDGRWALSRDANGIRAYKSPIGNSTSWLEWSGAVALTTRKIVRVETLWLTGSGTVAFKINGAAAPVLAQAGGVYWLDASAFSTLNTVRADLNAPTGEAAFYVGKISLVDSMAPSLTGRQNVRQIAVAGSARSQASLSLADPASALGSVLVYTSTDLNAHQPNLRQFLQSGPTVAPDSTVVSGATSDLSTVHTFDLPAAGVPAGGYLLLARLKHASAGARVVSYTANSRVGTTNDSPGQSGTRSITLAAGVWTVATVALLNLPTTQVGSSGKVRLTLSGPAGLLLDEAWLFNVDTGRLTWVECGTAAPSAGGSSNRLWLDTASITDPKPSIWRGNATDRSDAMQAGPNTSAWGVHEFVPPAINVFTVTSNSTAAALTLEHYPRWHTHAAA